MELTNSFIKIFQELIFNLKSYYSFICLSTEWAQLENLYNPFLS